MQDISSYAMAPSSRSTINVKIGGAAGAGIKSTGMTIAKSFARLGLSVFEYSEYPSLIRGGHNSEQILASVSPISSQTEGVDILLALNKETVALHQHELAQSGIVILDRKVVPEPLALSNQTILDVPLLELARKSGGDIMVNTVGIGAVFALLSLPLDAPRMAIEEEFHNKNPEISIANVAALQAGYEFMKSQYAQHIQNLMIPTSPTKSFLLTGNDAVGIGAITAGIGLYTAYPMTPTSSLLQFMIDHESEFGYVVRQPEDEIAAANMVVGAMHMGVRAMCATSGGGFALMNETLALAGMIEEPFVMMLGQRPGPATGLPTWTEQGELLYTIHAGHGEFLRFVLAPGDPVEAFELTAEAFNLAEQYQTPVIIMSDKYLGESAMTIPGLPTDTAQVSRGEILDSSQPASDGVNFDRYAITDSGVSPRTLPGTPGGVFCANSDEHDTKGMVDESSKTRVAMTEKRLRKFATAAATLPGPKVLGKQDAKVTVITWGSSKLPALHAMLTHPELSMNILHFTHIWPMNWDAVHKTLSSLSSKTIIIEGNATGQFESLLRGYVGFTPTAHLRRYDGRPFYPEQIVQAVKELQ